MEWTVRLRVDLIRFKSDAGLILENPSRFLFVGFGWGKFSE